MKIRVHDGTREYTTDHPLFERNHERVDRPLDFWAVTAIFALAFILGFVVRAQF